MSSGFTGVHYLSCLNSFELMMNRLVAKAVPKLNITLQYKLFGFTFAGSVLLVETTTKAMVQTQVINKSDYILTYFVH